MFLEAASLVFTPSYQREYTSEPHFRMQVVQQLLWTGTTFAVAAGLDMQLAILT